MPQFRYEAIDASGEVVRGDLMGADESAIVMQLQAQNMLPLTIKEEGSGGMAWRHLFQSQNQVTIKEIEVMTFQLAQLTKAGLPLDRSLTILISVAEEERMQRLLSRVQEQVRGGSSLADALEAQGNVFSRLYINMVRAGEASGTLEIVLVRLNEFLVRSRGLRDTVKTAMIYPTFLMSFAILTVCGLLVFVVPRFEAVFKNMGRTLPAITQVTVNAGHFVKNYWWLIGITIVLVFFGFKRRLQDPEFRMKWDTFLLNRWLIGDLIRKTETVRFARTLSTLLANGMPMLSALSNVREILTNAQMRDTVGSLLENMKSGQGIAAPLMNAKVFPPMAVHMIRVGEETGQLEPMLEEVATVYDDEVNSAVKRVLAMLEPMTIMIMGVFIGFIIMSIMAAIMSMNSIGR